MRVLYFTRDYGPHDHRFLSSLAASGNEIYSLRLERSGRNLEDRPLPVDVQQVQWAGGQRPFRWRDLPALVRDLRRVLKELQPDIVHAGPVQSAALVAALAGAKPLVTMSWGSDLLTDAGRSRWMKWATRFTLRRSTVLLGDCDAVRRKAESFGFPAERIVLFPWGVDLMRFSPGDKSQSGLRARLGWQDAFIVLSVRNWEPIYGVDTLVRGFARAAQQEPRLRLILLGNGSMAGQLREILLRKGVMEQVHFGGQVSNQNLPDYYHAADLYVSASHSDGSSVSLMEALASGLPALLSDIPANLEWVTFGGQGWFFGDGDDGALADRLLAAVDEWERLPEMGRAARALAERRADWPRNFSRMLDGYQLALSLSRSTGNPVSQRG